MGMFRLLPCVVLAFACLGRPALAADKLSVVLDWFVNADHESLLAAQYCGAYARHGLDVSFIPPADTSSPPRLVAAGQADLAVSYLADLQIMVEQQLPIVRVGSLIGQPLNVILAMPGTGIANLADLKGRRVGIAVSVGDEALLNGMLASAGLKPDAVTRVQINFQIEQALMTHSVDAVVGGMRNYELLDLRQKGVQPVVFYPEQHGVPSFDELILVANKAHAGDPRIQRFLEALREGTACLLNDPDRVWRAFVAAHPELDTPLNKAAWAATLPALARDPAHLDVARYAAFQHFLLAGGALARPLPISQYAQ